MMFFQSLPYFSMFSPIPGYFRETGTISGKPKTVSGKTETVSGNTKIKFPGPFPGKPGPFRVEIWNFPGPFRLGPLKMVSI